MIESIDPRDHLQPHLPKVNHDDVLHAFTDTAFDSIDMQTPWQQFANNQPILARELLQRAIFEYPENTPGDREAKRILIETATFIVQAMGYAAIRESLSLPKEIPAPEKPASAFDEMES